MNRGGGGTRTAEADGSAVVVKAVGAISEVDPGSWDACAGTANPFVSHAFLAALEESGATAAATGWAPYHLIVEDGAGALAGAAPMYLKGHSYGEYVFDHAWAAAYERANGRYYPKLLIAAPFTPVSGPRLMVAPGADAEATERALLGGALEVARRLEVSSLHVNFPDEGLWRRLGEAGFLLRTGEQFHWRNRGYADFDDFLADLSARKRKAIRKERREALGSGITIEAITGADLDESHWDAFFEFYMDTGERKWGQPYLNRRFFSLLGERMADRVVLFLAMRGGRIIAGALNLMGSDCLFGRYWGCAEQHKFLHFETCYYQAIDFAIAHGLERVEAGAQGPHKLQRAYLPVRTYSAHWIRDAGFREAVANYLEHEREEVDLEIEWLESHGPFRKTQAGTEAKTCE